MATATKTRRTQVAAVPVIKSNDELNDSLRDLCDIQSKVTEREAQLQKEITALREQCDDDLKDDLAQQARLEKDVEEYCTYYRDTIFPKDAKSLQLAHGKVDFRQHPPAVIVSKKKRMTLVAVMDAIKERWGKKAEQYIRTKEELNKEVLVTLEETELETVGLEIQRKETFGITLNLESIAPASTQGNRVVNL